MYKRRHVLCNCDFSMMHGTKGKKKEFYDINGETGYKGRENFCKEWLLLLSYEGMNVS